MLEERIDKILEQDWSARDKAVSIISTLSWFISKCQVGLAKNQIDLIDEGEYQFSEDVMDILADDYSSKVVNTFLKYVRCVDNDGNEVSPEVRAEFLSGRGEEEVTVA